MTCSLKMKLFDRLYLVEKNCGIILNNLEDNKEVDLIQIKSLLKNMEKQIRESYEGCLVQEVKENIRKTQHG